MAVSVLLAGCGDGGATLDDSDVVWRDSAGITIVETASPAWANGGGWTVDAEPVLVIGQLEGEAAYLFGELRGAIRLENGSVVAVDNQAREVRWFDSTGLFVRSVGGPGEGPEEFPRSAWQLERCGADRIYVQDRMAQRMLVWDTAGMFRRSFQFTEPLSARGFYQYVCRADGGFIGVGWGDLAAVPRPPAGLEAAPYSQQASVWALDSAGVVQTDLGSFLSSERIVTQGGSGPHPFGRAVSFAGGSDRVFIGDGTGLEVLIYASGSADADGDEAIGAPKPLTIWRAAWDSIPLGETFRQAYAEAELAGASVSARHFRDLILDGVIEMPPELPAYTELLVSPDGHLWAKRFILPWEAVERWGVFAPDGVFLGNVDFPRAVRVTEIGDDYVVGIATDELGVERVQVHRIRR